MQTVKHEEEVLQESVTVKVKPPFAWQYKGNLRAIRNAVKKGLIKKHEGRNCLSVYLAITEFVSDHSYTSYIKGESLVQRLAGYALLSEDTVRQTLKLMHQHGFLIYNQTRDHLGRFNQTEIELVTIDRPDPLRVEPETGGTRNGLNPKRLESAHVEENIVTRDIKDTKESIVKRDIKNVEEDSKDVEKYKVFPAQTEVCAASGANGKHLNEEAEDLLDGQDNPSESASFATEPSWGYNTIAPGQSWQQAGFQEPRQVPEAVEKPSAAKPKRSPLQLKYDQCLQAYERIRGVKLEGKEYNLIRRELKLMFDSNRTPEQIIKFMEWCERQEGSVWKSWTIFTIRKHIADFLAGRLDRGKVSSRGQVNMTKEEIEEWKSFLGKK